MGKAFSRPPKVTAESLNSIVSKAVTKSIQKVSSSCASIASQQVTSSVSGNTFYKDAVIKGGDISQNIKMNFTCLQTTSNVMKVTNDMKGSIQSEVQANAEGFGGPRAAARLVQEIDRDFKASAISDIVNNSISVNRQIAEVRHDSNVHYGVANIELASVDQTGEMISRTITNTKQVQDIINKVVDRQVGDVSAESKGITGGQIAMIVVGIIIFIIILLVIGLIMRFGNPFSSNKRSDPSNIIIRQI